MNAAAQENQIPESKYYILLGLYVGFWGLLQSLSMKLVPLDLSYAGLGIVAFSYGSFVHAFTFPCTDAAAEVWGAKRARMMVYLGVTIYVLATVLIYIATLLPPAEGWPHNEAYKSIFSAAPRIVLGSLIATIFAQLWDIYIFEWVKKRTGERYLWLRNNVSTIGSQFFDTVIFYSIGFYGIIPNDVLPKLIVGSYFLKLVVALIDTPVVYLVVRWLTGSWTAKDDAGATRANNAKA